MYLNIEKHESCNNAARVYVHVAHTNEELYGINVAFEDSPHYLLENQSSCGAQMSKTTIVLKPFALGGRELHHSKLQ